MITNILAAIGALFFVLGVVLFGVALLAYSIDPTQDR